MRGIFRILGKWENRLSKYYRVNCLKSAIEKVRKERPTSGSKNVKIFHKNAKNTRRQNRERLSKERLQIIDHPPYSPDLAPCDF